MIPAPRPARILHLLSGKEKGGILRALDAICGDLAGTFDEMCLAVLDDSSIALPPGARVVRFSRGSLLGGWRVPDVVRFARRERFTLVHSHNAVSNLYGWAIRSRVKGVSHIVHAHGHVGHVLADSQRSRLRRALLLRGNVAAMRRCDRVIAVAESIATYLVGLGIGRGKIHVIHNAVDPERIQADARRPCGVAAALPGTPCAPPAPSDPGRPWVVCSTGRLSAVKNHRVLLEAARLVLNRERALFVLCGDGPERNRLERFARDTGVADRVLFTGWMENPYPVMAAADLQVVHSNSEGLPVAAIEAMALGKAVVGTRVGGVPEAVREGINGLLVPPGDPAALATAILELLADPGRRASFGRAGERIVREDFSRAVLVRKVEEVYLSLTNAPMREAATAAPA